MGTEAEKRAHRACFTGHRPEKLRRSERKIKKDIEIEIRRAVADGLNVFISGMARGADIWAAQLVLKLRDAGEDVRLICVCPYEGVESGWSVKWRRQYDAVLKVADYVKFICSGYNPCCFQSRNEWMVNHSARVIAVFNDESGGTKHTLDYAAREGIPVVCIEG